MLFSTLLFINTKNTIVEAPHAKLARECSKYKEKEKSLLKYSPTVSSFVSVHTQAAVNDVLYKAV